MIDFEILNKRMSLNELNEKMLKYGCIPDLDYLDNGLDNNSISYEKILYDYNHDDYAIVYGLKQNKKSYVITLYLAYLSKNKNCKVNKIVIE